jgi:2-keto-4-pentenoate hydratase/2-oxohepta-3-ene-1,7-dioic acid hydratase in catechol pathway
MIFPLTASDLIEGIVQGDLFLEEAKKILQGEKAVEAYSLDEVEFTAPIPRPRKNIFCIGKNYRDHAIEIGGVDAIPKNLVVFTKAPTSVIGTDEPILYDPELTQAVDYEGELAIVIGKRGKKIKKEEAYEYIFGYTIINDVTARDLQQKHQQFFLGKSLDTFCPMGPYVVHKSRIPHPDQLHIETRVNGEVRQSSNTKHFIFDIPTILSTISQGITLEPGDLIATGTPAGVGKGFNPPRYLQHGDVVEVEIEGIGVLRNEVIARKG